MTKVSRFLLLAAAAVPLCAAPIEQGERDYALSQLWASKKLFMDALAGLSEAQWKFKPAPDRWSIAEVAEHLILSEDMLMGLVKKTLAAPAVSGRNVNRDQDAAFYAAIMDRSHKAQAPEAVRPVSGKWPTPAAAAKEFSARRDRTLDYARTTADDLRAHVTKLGDREVDAYHLLLMIAAHTERHVAQINDVKAAAGYPK